MAGLRIGTGEERRREVEFELVPRREFPAKLAFEGVAEELRDVLDDLKAPMQRRRRAMEDDSVVSREVVRVGSPSSEIVAFAEDEQPDLIVMGTRGHTEFKKLFLGSISSQVLQHAPCPVTVVR